MGRKPGQGTGAEVTSYGASCPPQASARPKGMAMRRVQPCKHPALGKGIPWLTQLARAPQTAASLLPHQQGTEDMAPAQPTGNWPEQGKCPCWD